MTDDRRRRFLEALSATGVAALAGCARLEDLFQSAQSRRATTATDRSTDEPTRTTVETNGIDLDVAARIDGALAYRPTPPIAPTFDYDPVAVSSLESDLFTRALARPADDAAGDRLQIQPTDAAPELAGLLRDLWNVPADRTVETTMADTAVTLTGGAGPRIAALVGTARFDRVPTVVVVRGADLSTAKAVLDETAFPLE